MCHSLITQFVIDYFGIPEIMRLVMSFMTYEHSTIFHWVAESYTIDSRYVMTSVAIRTDK